MTVCGRHNTAAMRNSVGGQKTLEANPLVLPSLGIYISHGWDEANGCGVCMPISLEPGVGIQLTIPPFPSLVGCTCCLTLRPDSGFPHFLSYWVQWIPVVTVIEGSQIFCDHSALSSCSHWSSCGGKCTNLFMFYISAPLNSWPTLQGLEGCLMKCFHVMLFIIQQM